MASCDSEQENSEEIDLKKEKWTREQEDLKTRMIHEDSESWMDTPDFSGLTLIAGLDISFIKGDETNVCASIVVLSFPELEVIYEDTCMMEITEPYLPGFLAFREAPIYVQLYEKLLSTTTIRPDLIMVDGNGKLHSREFGIASHVGVELNVASIGVAKTLFHVDGLENNEQHKQSMRSLTPEMDYKYLVGDSGTVYGAALRSGPSSKNPVYVSIGHKISLDTALEVVRRCSIRRIPEPTRQADIRSREYLRKKFPPST